MRLASELKEPAFATRDVLRGLERNAVVVLGNVGTRVNTDVLARALGDEEPLVREHAAWALPGVERP